MSQVRERLRSRGDDNFNRKHLARIGGQEYHAQLRVIREHYALGLSCFTYIFFLDPIERMRTRHMTSGVLNVGPKELEFLSEEESKDSVVSQKVNETMP